MKYREAKTGRARKSYGGDGRAIASIAIAGAAMLAVALCGGCLYTAVPALAGPSTTYPQGTGSQPAQTAEPSQTTNDPTNQNKQQNTAPPNVTPASSQNATP
jgi:S-formylglutathione hydrolase FrmB